jgi:hypothetical protein
MARNRVAEPSAVARAERGARAGRSSRVRRRFVERRFARRVCVLAPVLLAAAGVAAGSASALLPHHGNQRPLALLPHHGIQRRLALRLAADRAAPSLWLSGVTLHWTATASSHMYVESRTTGETTMYVLVAGTADTPPPLAGATVVYRVRPRYRPNAWSNQIEVTYPSRGKRERQREQREREEREAKERSEREATEKAEREAKEKAEREATEKAEREAKEKAEREAKEKVEREAREKVEREAKEKAEREQREREEREAKERSEREAIEKAEREAKERSEREAKERSEREAKEKAEREAKEKVEREAKEKAEREQREREEREKGTTGGAVALSAPPGVPAPSSGWHVAYADAFGAPLGSGPGQDNTVVSSEKWNGCCTNSNEVAVEQHSQVRVGSAGLEEVCSVGSFTVEGHTRGASCGGVRSDAFFEFSPASVGEWAVECYVRMPVDAGGADPGCWTYPSESGEIDFFELWGWNGLSWATANGGMPAVVGQGEHELSPVDSLGFDPSLAFHRYTTAFVPEGSGRYDVREYIDGAFRWDLPGRALSSAYDGLILTNGLRLRVQPDALTVRSIELYQEGAHAGQGVRGGGIAPGTTVK